MQTKAARYKFQVRSYETDFNNRLKMSSVFNFMQFAAGLNANALGFGYDQFSPLGYFWVLSRVLVEWRGNVQFDEDIIIETWPSGIQGLLATRDFKFYSSDEELLGKAKTAWLIMDQKSGRPVPSERLAFPLPEFDIPPAINNTPGKIRDPENKTTLGKRRAVYSDIDVNQHVNNAKYIEYIFDALPASLQNHKQNLRFQINYIKEMKLHETIELYYTESTENTNCHYVDACNEQGHRVFQCLLCLL
jgi:acyl-ACP thioesterase